MDPDADLTMNPSSPDGTTREEGSWHDLTVNTDPPSVDCLFTYTEADTTYIQLIEKEARELFPIGKVYDNHEELRKHVRQFAYQKGFEISTAGWTFCCSRMDEPKSHINKREKKNASGLVPIKKRRTYTNSLRCGCPFKICYSRLKPKNSIKQLR